MLDLLSHRKTRRRRLRDMRFGREGEGGSQRDVFWAGGGRATGAPTR